MAFAVEDILGEFAEASRLGDGWDWSTHYSVITRGLKREAEESRSAALTRINSRRRMAYEKARRAREKAQRTWAKPYVIVPYATEVMPCPECGGQVKRYEGHAQLHHIGTAYSRCTYGAKTKP